MIEIPVEGRSRETKISRDARGRWRNDGVEITHPALCRAFDGWIDRADDGRYCLKNDVNWAYVEIEGAPIFARGATLEGERVRLTLSDGRDELLDPATLRLCPAGRLHCDVRGGTMPCALTDAAMVALGPALHEDAFGLALRLGQTRVRPAHASDPLVPVRSAVIEALGP